ncbi:MAG: trimethylamine methyltransferase family protein [Bacteroidetes bacterium]|nr:trimethylamine methyltransferase family protein [Bacteroidota bacterium]
MKKIRPLLLLEPHEMETLHERTLDILAETGLYIDHDGFLHKLEAVGAEIDYTHRTAKFPRKLVHDAVKKTSGKKALLHHNPAQEVLLERPVKPLMFNFGGTALYVNGSDRKSTRIAKYADLERMVRFGNGHPRILSVGGPPVQMAYDENENEISANQRLLAGMTYLAKHCAKPGVAEIDSRRDVLYAEKLNEIIGNNQKKDSFLCVRCTISPLKIGFETADVLYTLAERKMPLGLAPMPLAGATAPVTIASALLIANAEILGMITALDAVACESAQEHIMLSGILDMRNGGANFSTPDAVLQDVGMAQLYSTYYDIPLLAPTDYIDASYPSYQSGYERAMKVAVTTLANCVYPSVGQLGAGLICSPTQACLDMEAFDWAAHFLKGIEVTEESLCVDLIKERGIGGHFLDADHTFDNFRSELFIPKTSNIGQGEIKTLVDLAEEEAEKIITETPLYSRDSAVCREIDTLYACELKERNL